jgi:hypothetical protein
MQKKHILTKDREGKGLTSAWVIWGHNRLNQRRQVATDGVLFWYQPTTRSPFVPVSEQDIPDAVRRDLLAIIIESAYRRSEFAVVGEVQVTQKDALNFDVFVVKTPIASYTAQRQNDGVWTLAPS